MDITIYPGKLQGNVAAIPSKSQAHRLLICAAFSDRETMMRCPETNRDIEATVDCLRALGAQITRSQEGYLVKPVRQIPEKATLNCGESGSTLRFMLPIAGALGVDATFQMAGRLPSRPLSPLWEEMERMGCRLSRPTVNTIRCTGRLSAGAYMIDGSVSSQFITGLLFASALIPGETELHINGRVESQPYISMTYQALSMFGVDAKNNCIGSVYPFRSPRQVTVEGDWSNAAFFLTASFLGNSLTVSGLSDTSAQGDRAVTDILRRMDERIVIDAANIPDLVPILSVAAGAACGAVFTNIRRLRLKESDRVSSVSDMLRALGCDVQSDENTLTVFPGTYHGCTVDASGDHRIAMAAAIAATVADGPVTIVGADCVSKSYPAFWEVFRSLGGNYEQHIR